MKYDVFISSKSEDYPLAEQVNDFLSKQGLKVFLACKELDRLGESEYAIAIDEALDKTNHMIVIASSLEYINSKWVRYEWSTFCNDLKSNFRTGNLITILDISLSIQDLPASLRHRQSFTFLNFEDHLLSYLHSNIKQNDEFQSSDTFDTLESMEKEDYSIIDSFDEIDNKLSSDEWFIRGYNAYYGKMGEKDTSLAVRCFLKAAENEHVEAQKFLSKCYKCGIGVERDYNKAYYWSSRAAINNDIESLNEIAKFYYENKYYEEAFLCYNNIVDLLYNDKSKDIRISQVLLDKLNPPDDYYFELAYNYYKNEGQYLLLAICRIGEMYEEGLYVQKNNNKAKEWYKKAKNLGFSKPLENHLIKIKTEMNDRIANEIPEILSIEEKYELANRYLTGKSIPMSAEKAVPLLETCSDYGHLEAAKLLSHCYQYGIGCNKNIQRSITLLEKVVEKSNAPESEYKLGLLLEVYRNSMNDFKRAVSLFIHSSLKEYRVAIEHLATLFRYKKLNGKNDFVAESICRKYSVCIPDGCGDSIRNLLFEDLNQLNLFDDVQDILKKCNINIDELLENSKNIAFELSDFYNNEILPKQSMLLSLIKNKRKQEFSNLVNNLDFNSFNIKYDFDDFSNGIETVDLGLKSGVLWANKNVGSDSYFINGQLYAWAEVNAKNIYNWETYFDKRSKSEIIKVKELFNKHPEDFICHFVSSNSEKYYNRFAYINYQQTSYIIKKTDCAQVYFGDQWSIPQKKHFQELIDYCVWEWIDNAKECGYKIIGENGKSIFFPVTNKDKKFGTYWTFTLYEDKSSKYAYCLFFKKGEYKIIATKRCFGLFVRPIALIDNQGNNLSNHNCFLNYGNPFRLLELEESNTHRF